MLVHFLNNPSGRHVGDCTVRALSKALDLTWDEAYARLAAQGFIMCDMPSSNAVFGAVLKERGFSRYAIPNTCPDCYDIGDFADDHPNGMYVVGTGSHVVAVKDGIIFDSWDSTKEIPLYYWSREERKDD